MLFNQYPIGTYQPQPYSTELHQQYLLDIQVLPMHAEKAIENLDAAHLQTPYREGGWTVHQLVHHIADSHINAYTRFKLGYTEDNPTIKPYDETLWAKLEDVEALPINYSITLLFALHKRWHTFLKSLTAADLQQKTVVHPEHGKQMTLWYLLGMYAWHGKHHVAQINTLRQTKNW
jgi:uncharacterized damage-inducible protein DinB